MSKIRVSAGLKVTGTEFNRVSHLVEKSNVTGLDDERASIVLKKAGLFEGMTTAIMRFIFFKRWAEGKKKEEGSGGNGPEG